MSKTMKWILRILVGLVIVCVVVAVGYLVFSYVRGPAWEMGIHTQRFLPREQGIPRNVIPVLPYRLLRDGGFLRTFPLGNFFVGLICLGLLLIPASALGALIYSRVNSRKPDVVTAPVISSTQEAESAETAAAIQSCPNCQRVVNEDWAHCPYCGTELTHSE